MDEDKAKTMWTNDYASILWKSTAAKLVWCGIGFILLFGYEPKSVLTGRMWQGGWDRRYLHSSLQSRDDIPYYIDQSCAIDVRQLCLPPPSIDDVHNVHLVVDMPNEVSIVGLHNDGPSLICIKVAEYLKTKYLHYHYFGYDAENPDISMVCDQGQPSEEMNLKSVQDLIVETFRIIFLDDTRYACIKPLLVSTVAEEKRTYYDPDLCVGIIASLRALLTDTISYENLDNSTIFLNRDFPLLGYDEKLVDEAIDRAAQEIGSQPVPTIDKPDAIFDIMGLYHATRFPQRTPLATTSYAFLGNYYEHKVTCLHSQYDNNQRLVPSCATALERVTAKLQQVEFRMGIPVARWTFYAYLVLGLVAIYRLRKMTLKGRKLETIKARRRRKFLEMLHDPVIRRHAERMAELRGEPDVAQYMADLDARGAKMIAESTMADAEWRLNEAKNEAWKRTLAFLWNIRRACVGATLFSLFLFVFDNDAETEYLLYGLLVILFTLIGTSVCLPASPMLQTEPKTDPLDSAAEPLLKGNGDHSP